MPVAIEDPSVAHASRNRKRKFGHLSKQVHIRYMRYTAEPDTENSSYQAEVNVGIGGEPWEVDGQSVQALVDFN